MSIDPEQYHQILARQNMEQIERAAVKAFDQRLEIPVVMVLDMADPSAAAMAVEGGVQESQLNTWVTKNNRRGLETVLVSSVRARDAMEMLRQQHPQAADPLEPLPDCNAFCIVVVA